MSFFLRFGRLHFRTGHNNNSTKLGRITMSGQLTHLAKLPKFVTRSLTVATMTPDRLRHEFQQLQASAESTDMIQKFKQIPKVHDTRVFANNKCNLNYMKAFGFDFDFTLANYNKQSGNILYDNTIEYLVKTLGYPEILLKNEYDPHFAAKGLAFDRVNGNLLKLNQFYKIGLRTVYNGRSKVPIENVLKEYGGARVSENYFYQNMITLDNLFSVPEGCLYADVIECLKKENFAFEPEYVATDVKEALDFVHNTGLFHKTVSLEPWKYVQRQKGLSDLIERLKNDNMKLFLLTNSDYTFINAPCEYIFANTCQKLGLKHWTQIFDWSITRAQKPDWFTAKHRFREYDPETEMVKLTSVDKLKTGTVYVGGCLEKFSESTGLKGESVLYFGDSVHSDLKGPMKAGEWKTCAIVHELDEEIEVNNDPKFRSYLGYVLEIEYLLDSAQHLQDNESILIMDKLRAKRSELRNNLIASYKSKFGSMFRTHSTRTMFFYRLARYADLYTSQVVNMINYPSHYDFNSRRHFYDHEPNYWSWPYILNDQNQPNRNSSSDPNESDIE